MGVILMNEHKQRVTIAVVLICLCTVLFFSGMLFKNQLRTVALINNNISSLKKYEAKEKYTYSLPENWSTEEENFPGNVILHHNSFKNDKVDMNGYIQIINSKGSIQDLIGQDKENLNSKDISAYSAKDIKLNGKNAKKIGYIEKLKNGKYYTKRVYYIELSEGIIFKGCFNINSDNYNESLDSVYETIMESGKYM